MNEGGAAMVADGGGAGLIPVAMLDHGVAEAPEQERAEGWIMEQVKRGAELPGLYPMNEETRARYAAGKDSLD